MLKCDNCKIYTLYEFSNKINMIYDLKSASNNSNMIKKETTRYFITQDRKKTYYVKTLFRKSLKRNSLIKNPFLALDKISRNNKLKYSKRR